MYEIQILSKKQDEVCEDVNAPIYKYGPDFKESMKDLLHTSCEALGCPTLKQLVRLAGKTRNIY